MSLTLTEMCSKFTYEPLNIKSTGLYGFGDFSKTPYPGSKSWLRLIPGNIVSHAYVFIYSILPFHYHTGSDGRSLFRDSHFYMDRVEQIRSLRTYIRIFLPSVRHVM